VRAAASVLLAGGVLVGSAHVAHAQSNDVLSATARLDMKYDSNLFLLPSDANAASLIGTSKKSAFVYTEDADFLFDKTYSLQHFKVEADALHQSFQGFHYLDFSTVNYNAQWDWHLSPRLTGDIGASRHEELGDYADFQQYNVRNLETSNEQHFNVDFNAFPHWHLIGGLQRFSLDNPDAFSEVGSFTENSVQAGVKYVSTPGNQVTVLVRNSVGTFDRTLDPINLLDTQYVQRQAKLIVDYRLSGHSTMQGWVGYTNRQYGTFSVRDFSGPIGGASLNWTPTDKTSVNVSFVHDLIDYEDEASSYYMTNVVRIKPTWDVTSKVRVSAALEFAYNAFRDPVVPNSTLRSDKEWGSELRVEYRPIKSTVLAAYTHWRKRSSNVDEFRYDDNVVGISGSFTF
jgi:exopolysaccharide biosynthesis operon protein EpsL